jgi:nitrogen regulatory protein PII
MIGSVIMDNMSLMVMIFNKKLEKKYKFLLQRYRVKYNVLLYGTGTASSSVLEYFGLNEIRRDIILSALPYNLSKLILKQLDQKFKMNEPGNGIAFTIPISSSTKNMKDSYRDYDVEETIMEEANKHLIVTIASEGYAEEVMNAAKKVGATGGTTLNGRGLETDKIVKFLGISIEPEKDVVLILADENIKNKIMDSILESCGLKTMGKGICFSLPVSHVVGLKNIIE